MLGTRSFRQRIFLAILLVSLVPTALAVSAATLVVRELGSTVGTLGPWDAVALSGRELIEAVRSTVPDDTAAQRAADAHGEALSQSLRWSRLWSVVNERFLAALPWIGLATAAAVALLAFLTARILAGNFSRPIQELIGWTGRIGRGEALPTPEPSESEGVEEFRTLRASLRTMATELSESRRREVESARLKAWTEMARRVAHELKNPLTPMRLAATTIARDDDADRARSGRVLLDEIERLDEMARTFSQFGRMPEGPRSEVDVPELLRSLAGRHGAEGHPIRVEAPDGLPTISGHYEVLSRAFRNLIVNAVEATQTTGADEGDRSYPVVLLVDRVPGGVRTRIQDRGPGIQEAILDRLFEPDVTTKRRGTGLGLAIVRQAVDAHGGSVAARNRTDGGGGAEIEVILPTARSEEERWTS